VKRLRNGKYQNYKKRILQFLIEQNVRRPSYIVGASYIRLHLKIPKSSLYDVLGKLSYNRYIDWIGEPQDWTSEIEITEKGKDYLKSLTNPQE